jgi:hypothetical protein
VLVALAVGVLAHKHEPVALQSAVVVANRVAPFVLCRDILYGKSLHNSDLPGKAKEGTSLASIPSLAIGSASPALCLPIRQPTLADKPR